MQKLPDEAERWARARAHFLDLVELEPKPRGLALARLANEDADVATFVERLLAQDAGAETRVARPAARGREVIGPYTVLEKLGEGGFGSVYRARQEHPIVREVALKVQKAGLDSPELVARFADERRYLARIDHPDVVKVLDAGVTDDGRLFVAMELVRGEPITEYVARERPPLAERVALMERVARAVHHVHQRAILHRDLKPTNILVTRIDGVPRPRLIDFGIATALSNADRAGWTRLVGPICTPGYAAPEQLAGSEDIDVRADVYALGCVLCECLTGQRPRDSDAAATTPLRRPSELSLTADQAARTSPVAPAALRGDLDRVVMKCIAADPDERYQSAAELAADLERFRRHEPVHATKPTGWTIVLKFARRNRAVVAVTSAALCLIAVAVVLAVDGRLRAVNERAVALAARDDARLAADRAQTVTKYFLEDMVQRFDFDARPEHPMTLMEVLAAAEANAATRYAGDPALRALVLAVVGRSHFKATRYLDAERTLRAALAAADEAHGVPNRDSFELLLLLSDTQLLIDGGRTSGLGDFERARSDAAQLFPAGSFERLRLERRGTTQPRELIEVLTRLIAASEENDARGTEDYFSSLQLLAAAQRMERHFDEEIVTLRALRAEALQSLGVDHSAVIGITGDLGRALFGQGQRHEGLGLTVDAHERSQRVLGPDHESSRRIALEYAHQLGALGRAAEGVPIARDAAERTARITGGDSMQSGNSFGTLGRLLSLSGDLTGAESVQRRVLTLRSAQWSGKHAMRLDAMQDLAATLVRLGSFEEALALAEDAAARADPKSPRAIRIACLQAQALHGMELGGQARVVLDEALAAGVAAGLDALALAPARELRASLDL